MAGKCFNCKPGVNNGGCALMGYHADLSPSLGFENEISTSTHYGSSHLPASSKYFTTTGKEFPYCRKYLKTRILHYSLKEIFTFMIIVNILFFYREK